MEKYQTMKIDRKLMKHYIDRTACVYDDNERELLRIRKKAGFQPVNVKRFYIVNL